MFQFSRGQQVVLVLLLAAILSGAVILRQTRSHRAPEEPLLVAPTAAESPGRIVVHVAGAVKNPGPYSLAPGSRVKDAIQQAGGATAQAVLDDLNLATFLQDGEKVVVPTKAPEPAAGAPSETGASRPSPTGNPTEAQPRLSKISLNRASAEQLEELPGIGPVYARKILEFRQQLRSQNGQGYTSVEQLLEIPGIGSKRFERIKPRVTL